MEERQVGKEGEGTEGGRRRSREGEASREERREKGRKGRRGSREGEASREERREM